MTPSRPFAFDDKESLDNYCERMEWFQTRATEILPLDKGLTFELALAAPNDIGGVDARRSPIGRIQAMATYVLVKALQQGPQYQSQVWLARPTSSDPSTTIELVLKFIIPSHLEMPGFDVVSENCVNLAEYTFPDDIVAYQVAAYQALGDLQGITVPYFYGVNEVSVPWGEPGVQVLALEYIHGPRMTEVATVVDSEDSAPSELIKYRDYDTYLALLETGISTLLQAHARGIVHCDVRDANVLIDVAHNQVVFLDWTNDAPPHLAGIGCEHDPKLNMSIDIVQLARLFEYPSLHAKRIYEYFDSRFPWLGVFWGRPRAPDGSLLYPELSL
ncbi:uncharacterized protein SCHCODRAFT_02490224 [Schizophyllum commune H4-8]|uniref:uncharacterized protein n=1 Tax=Schizophyllum commune (strain H4-8 / FGSC 9210) TaxID=578458 RepID=UPI002160F6CB|nr:uncharacterized protein SCHCODRAFT_02490224 [Schizophyllum commune H4-8]KAI5897851.1 hypothetical protein SCHCODRAFT_02490224 [Schizophyllum commune H4-8]